MSKNKNKITPKTLTNDEITDQNDSALVSKSARKKKQKSLVQRDFYKNTNKTRNRTAFTKINYKARTGTHLESSLALLGKKSANKKGKKTVVLNLDETLVHSKFGRHEDADKFFCFKSDTAYYAISMYMRPHLDQFLTFLCENFEVVFYTSAIEKYANEVFDQIDPERKAESRLYRDSCMFRDGLYIKTLKRLRRHPSTVIVLENNPISVCFNPNNVFPIKSWFGNKKDKELLDIIPILKSLATVKDVRGVIKRIFDSTGITHSESNQHVNDLYQNSKNIKEADQLNYKAVMGNYYPPMEEYDPIKISKNLSKTEMISSSGTAVKYPDEEVNYILFCHALNNPEEALNTEEVQDEEENINHGPRKIILYNPIEEEEFEESSMNVKENPSSHNKITITESNPSFAVKMLKNFQDPSSLTISEDQSKSDVSMGIPQSTKLSEHLKAFFCFDK